MTCHEGQDFTSGSVLASVLRQGGVLVSLPLPPSVGITREGQGERVCSFVGVPVWDDRVNNFTRWWEMIISPPGQTGIGAKQTGIMVGLIEHIFKRREAWVIPADPQGLTPGSAGLFIFCFIKGPYACYLSSKFFGSICFLFVSNFPCFKFFY